MFLPAPAVTEQGDEPHAKQEPRGGLGYVYIRTYSNDCDIGSVPNDLLKCAVLRDCSVRIVCQEWVNVRVGLKDYVYKLRSDSSKSH